MNTTNNNNDMPVLNRSILDVRRVLMDQLERLNNPSADIAKEFDRSKAIALVANPLIHTAKIEAELLANVPKYQGTGFFNTQPQLENN